MASTLRLEIVTPEGLLLSENVDSVTLQAADGQVTILPEHTRLMTQLVPGEMVIGRAGQERLFALGEGLALVTSESVAIATDMAIAAENIDQEAVDQARQRAAARLRERIDSEEVASVNAALARSLAQLHVKRRSRK